jgi:hypothetical protein
MTSEQVNPAAMTTAQAAEHLGFVPNTMARYRAEKKGPDYYKIGRDVRYSAEDLDRWYEAQKVTHDS